MKKKAKKKKVEWLDLPQKDWGQWFGQHIMSGLVLEFFSKHKKWPKRIKLSDLSVKELESGEGLLSVDME